MPDFQHLIGGTLPDADNAGINITLDYVQIGGAIPVYSKTFAFTILGGSYIPPQMGETVSAEPAYVYDSAFLRLLDLVLARFHLQDLLRIVCTAVRERLAGR